ncbi:MAG: hypothetical protein ACE366_16935 [Bradymonadia bacterium]
MYRRSHRLTLRSLSSSLIFGLALLCMPCSVQADSLGPAPIAVPTVEAIRIAGVSRLRKATAASLIKIPIGSPLDEGEVNEARLRMLATGLFQSVSTRLTKGSARGQVVVVFDCEERSTVSLDALHFGQARPSGLWIGAEASDRDPFGVGVSPSVGFVSSGEQNAGRLSLRGFRLLEDQLGLSMSLRWLSALEPMVGPASQRLEGRTVSHVDLPYRRLGGSMSLDVSPMPLVTLHLTLGVDHIDAEVPEDAESVAAGGEATPFDFMLEDGGSWLLTGRFSAALDTRDDPASPHRGMRLGLEVNGGVIDYPFVGVLLGFEHFAPLPFGHVLQSHVRMGGVHGDAPFFERFFIGDLHSYVPGRVLGLNFARRRGPLILGGPMGEQRYERVAGRAGLEYRLPLGDPEPYPVELFLGGAGVSLFSPEEWADRPIDAPKGLPIDVVFDIGLRIESEIGVVGLSLSSIFIISEP